MGNDADATELQQAVALLMGRRFNDLAYRLDGAAGHLDRESLFSTCAESLETHCRDLRRDLVALLDIFGGLRRADWIHQQYAAHVDRAVAEHRKRLPELGSNDRNRLANLAAVLKGRAREAIAEEVASAERRRADSAKPGLAVTDLDDRLPLGRRRAFDQSLAEGAARAAAGGEPIALVMIDIDRFKRVNDEHGHPVGDEVLLAVAQRIVARLGRKGATYRYGGEEFAVLLPSYSADEAAGLAERLRKDIEAEPASSRGLPITASLGVAAAPEHAKDARALLEQADRALYEAKNGGRNQVRIAGA